MTDPLDERGPDGVSERWKQTFIPPAVRTLADSILEERMTEKKQSKLERVEAEWGEASRRRAEALNLPPYDTLWDDDLEWLRCYAARRLATRYALLDAFSKLKLLRDVGIDELRLTTTLAGEQRWCATLRFDQREKYVYANPSSMWLLRIDDWIHTFERRLADMVNQ